MSQFTIIGAEPGERFQLTTIPTRMADATFVAVYGTTVHVTRRLSDLLTLPDDTPVVAHWHGQRRTDGFALTVGELKRMVPA
jgi:hypothetical protein